MKADWAEFGGKLSFPDEYLVLGYSIPKELNKRHCIYGPSLFVHYSHFPQNEGIDPKYLEAYTKLAQEVSCEEN